MVHDIGPRVARALGLEHVAWLSCADLTYQSKRALQQRFPDAIFVNVRNFSNRPRSVNLELLRDGNLVAVEPLQLAGDEPVAS